MSNCRRFFLEGDKARVLARVHNLTDYQGPAQLLLEIEMGDDRVVQPQQVQISGNRTVELVFDPVAIRACRQCRITVTATIAVKGLARRGKAGAMGAAMGYGIPSATAAVKPTPVPLPLSNCLVIIIEASG